ncbi:MAG TPA: MiaB/RimO family radical SAM methylthiotransferase [Treponemataceae bacterium]|nr:MiaB/RimO family radical SAM methylthiotransferase [Treponemataceae bacterium]
MLFFLDQYGCAKNQVDGELLIGILCEKGWTRTDEPERADLIIINSCGFIESAKKESLDAVMTARAAYPQAKVLLAGCLSERYADDLAESLSEADALFGNGDLSRFPELLDKLFPTGSTDPTGTTVLRPQICGVPEGARPELLSFPGSAYVKITEGCDNCCTFCAIPLIRGPLRSRPIERIVSEIAGLVSRGVWEINLIGQDLGSYGKDFDETAADSEHPAGGEHPGAGDQHPAGSEHPADGTLSPLAELLSAIGRLPGDFRIRLLYIHPDNFPRDILPVMAANTRFFPYFDIPFQAGEETILRSMNRRGNPDAYLRLVADIRNAFTESPYGMAVLRTTFLVGFPRETDETFEKTARFLASLRSVWSGAFIWSREEGTAAADYPRAPAKKTAQKRLDTLLEIQRRMTPEELAFFVGKRVEVLVEELIPLSDEEVAESEKNGIPPSRLALARAWFQAPEVDGSVVLQFDEGSRDSRGNPVAPGSVVEALIMQVNGIDVEAVLP